MIWMLKISRDEFVMWDTATDEIVDGPMDRKAALSAAIERALRADPHVAADVTLKIGHETLLWLDKHLCSCRARLGETIERRNGRMVAIGGGDLAYHFDSYDEVREWIRAHAQNRQEAEGGC